MSEKLTVGWREWVSLPELAISKIKAKIDTGARTSTLHAFRLEPYTCNSARRVKFFMHPLQNNTQHIIECDAVVHDYRFVTDSGGHREKRYVIETELQLSNKLWTIEITLTNRETMRFRMLLGRTAMCDKLIVDPEKSYLLRKKQAQN
ncbi:MAG: ATP-dependent zinc protease [Gammaproteobacteria bacterium]|nr:ATP-dependent zinc protease [Gammaproteobacteria bacterium]